MRNEQNNCFAGRLIELYSAAALSAVVLDGDFSVIDRTAAACDALPYLVAPGGARAFFEPYGIDAIKAEIAARGSFLVEPGSLFGGCALTVCAIDDGDARAYLVLPSVTPGGTGPRPEGVLRTIGTFDSQYRTRLNRLFAAIGSVSRALEPQATDEERLRAPEYLERVDQNAFLLLRSCEWISLHTRLSHGLVPLRRVPVELYGWLRGLFASTRKICAEHGIPLAVFLPAGELYTLCDLERLTDVTANLISNCCRFTRPGNRIEIRVRRVGEKRLSFSVIDNGLGIPADVMPRIFEPYYSFSRDGHPFSGNGLGLSIVWDTVALLGGTVHATSFEGDGTTMLFTLPIEELDPAFYATESDLPDYFSDRFSPLRVALADASDGFA